MSDDGQQLTQITEMIMKTGELCNYKYALLSMHLQDLHICLAIHHVFRQHYACLCNFCADSLHQHIVKRRVAVLIFGDLSSLLAKPTCQFSLPTQSAT